MAKTAVVPAKGKAPAPAKVSKSTALAPQPATMDIFLANVGAGLEGATAQDFALPWLQLLQKLSPQLDKTESSYIEGAREGQWLNTVTGETFDELEVIPVDFQKVYNEWIPRDQGGGFVKSYKDRGEADTNKQDNTTIVDTANHFVLVKSEDGAWSGAILSMTSTKLKVSRQWMSKIAQRMITGPGGVKKVAPSYSTIYRVGSQATKNDKGSFVIPTVEVVEWVQDVSVVEQAIDFRSQVQSGLKGADFNTVDAEFTTESDEDTDVPAGAKGKARR